MLASKEKYLNAYYESPDVNKLRELFPSIAIKFLRLWKEFFLKYLSNSKEKYTNESFAE